MFFEINSNMMFVVVHIGLQLSVLYRHERNMHTLPHNTTGLFSLFRQIFRRLIMVNGPFQRANETL